MCLLSRKFTISSKPSIVLYGKELNFVDKYKYLGFNMTITIVVMIVILTVRCDPFILGVTT